MANVTESGRRRLGRNQEEATSKKKLKDKVNQENKEGKNAVSSEPKKDLFSEWKQNADEVIVKLKLGEGAVKVDDIDAAFTDTDCVVTLPDGRQWSCQFHEEIESSCSKVQYKEKGNILQLLVQKKIPLHTWPSLWKKGKEQPIVAQPKENGKEKISRTENIMEEGRSLRLSDSNDKKKTKADRGVKRAINLKTPEKNDCLPEPGVKRTILYKAPEEPRLVPETVAEQKIVDEPNKETDIASQERGAKCAAPGKSAETESSANNPDERLAAGAFESKGKRDGRGPQGDGHMAEKRNGTGQSSSERAEIEVTEKERPFLESQAHDVPLTQLPSEDVCETTSGNVSVAVEQVVDEMTAETQADGSVREMLGCTENAVEKPLTKDDVQGSVREEIDQAAGEQLLMEALAQDAEAIIDPLTDVEKTDQPKEVASEENAEAPEHYVNLSFVKYDSYEKGTDSMVVHVYVKEICKSTSKVLFREQDFTLIFQTRHNVFLRLHPGCGPNTIFKWQVKVRNLLNPEQCMYTFTASRIDICLKKRQNQRWGGLEALAAQVGGAKVAVPAGPPSLDKAQPGSSQHALPPKEEPRPSDKEKVRSEEASLDSVAVRSGPESVQIKQDALLTLPKPTCMVTPMTHSLASGEQAEEEEEEKKVCLPGFTGLVNLGNTCFMNSVIQSLSNTRELRDYFHDRSFETEINYNNPLGTGGRLAIGFAVLLQALWKGTHHAYQPSKLKAIVASKASQFTGYAQHDAQEFMAFLLDGLHEDLNRIQNKPYTETVDSDGRLDEVVAEEAWDRHKMRNDSFIVDLFQGQYKSKLVCPVCYKVSITFDPFLYLPVPLPQKQKVLTVYFFAKEPHKKPVKILVSVSKENSNASDVLDAISRNLKVKVETLRLTEVVRNRFHRIFEPCQSLENTSPSDTLLCFEVLTKELAKEQVVELQVQQRLMVPKIPINKCAACHKPQQPDEKLRRCTSCYRVAYCNQTCQVNHWTDHKNQCRPENIGYPFLISVPKSRLTFSRLTQLLEGYSRYSVNVFQPPFQAGRITPEPPPSKPDAPPLVSANVSSAETGEKKLPPTAEVQERDFKPVRHAHLTGSASEPLLTSAFTKELNMPAKDRDSVHSYDSGFSESRTESHEDSGCEKETSYEKAAKPEAAVPGYQQRAESARSHTSQFHIKFIDSSRKEEKVDDKGDMPLEFPDCVSLAMIWKNNERQKEYVLVESRELEYMEDPCSASDAARAGYFTLEQCLNLFTKPEVLAPEEAWYCPKCKQHREASKQLMLWRLPNVLIIQLKRFSFRNFIWRDKINDMVEFPIRNLDLSKFCIGQKDDRQQPIYDLYAVINHYGGMIGGHYTAYARLPSDKNSQRSDVGWRLFDDSTVTTVDESQVAARHAYVLFYRRRNSPVVRPVRTRAGGRGAECATGAEGASTQASLIWQELEAEETGDETSHSADRHTQGVRPLRTRISEELSATPLPDYSDEDCIKYFVLSTLAAMIALFVNLLYPLII
ncbi:ubiquitin carboxyl-terminal hydrolase 19 isoform X9 [Callorhinchus milii]|uniref:ubiquitin carboxyl-terminal hydrolase 19 isoform X9 n=1 Tax=Callorhinchus milii TaxID=7868 RepID=UPI0004573F86|nr:ubiquitin carboxyl-terminal hydrolase 19 isoform X9 [Callorhinchus milii]|eukprot:gi/632946506/ref/XP_007888592.1/ PREDICTED: ubiquitin carboxyl-terminal hydrolase 19 isoform X8 [Callorhinchus milii]